MHLVAIQQKSGGPNKLAVKGLHLQIPDGGSRVGGVRKAVKLYPSPQVYEAPMELPVVMTSSSSSSGDSGSSSSSSGGGGSVQGGGGAVVNEFVTGDVGNDLTDGVPTVTTTSVPVIPASSSFSNDVILNTGINFTQISANNTPRVHHHRRTTSASIQTVQEVRTSPLMPRRSAGYGLNSTIRTRPRTDSGGSVTGGALSASSSPTFFLAASSSPIGRSGVVSDDKGLDSLMISSGVGQVGGVEQQQQQQQRQQQEYQQQHRLQKEQSLEQMPLQLKPLDTPVASYRSDITHQLPPFNHHFQPQIQIQHVTPIQTLANPSIDSHQPRSNISNSHSISCQQPVFEEGYSVMNLDGLASHHQLQHQQQQQVHQQQHQQQHQRQQRQQQQQQQEPPSTHPTIAFPGVPNRVLRRAHSQSFSFGSEGFGGGEFGRSQAASGYSSDFVQSTNDLTLSTTAAVGIPLEILGHPGDDNIPRRGVQGERRPDVGLVSDGFLSSSTCVQFDTQSRNAANLPPHNLFLSSPDVHLPSHNHGYSDYNITPSQAITIPINPDQQQQRLQLPQQQPSSYHSQSNINVSNRALKKRHSIASLSSSGSSGDRGWNYGQSAAARPPIIDDSNAIMVGGFVPPSGSSLSSSYGRSSFQNGILVNSMRHGSMGLYGQHVHENCSNPPNSGVSTLYADSLRANPMQLTIPTPPNHPGFMHSISHSNSMPSLIGSPISPSDGRYLPPNSLLNHTSNARCRSPPTPQLKKHQSPLHQQQSGDHK